MSRCHRVTHPRAMMVVMGLFLTALAPAPVFAQEGTGDSQLRGDKGGPGDCKAKRGHWKKKGDRGHFAILRMADELELSEEQRADIRAVLDYARAEKKRLRDAPRDERREGFHRLHREVREQIRAVLTPEQRDRARELRRERWNEKRERRMQRMAERLDLSDQQLERVREIKRRAHEQKRALRDRTRADIRAVLSPEQRDRFDDMRRSFKRHRPER